jgi:hypothetical protein
MSGGGNIDLNTVFPGAGKVTIEPKETLEDAQHRRRKDMILFCVVLALVVVIVLACGWVILFSALPAETKNNAGHLVGLFIGGAIGYVFGKIGD